MGEKYSPEKLAAMRSIGFNKTGQTKHSSAGVPIAEVKDTAEKRETIDINGSVITEQKDGSQDVNIHAKPIIASFTQGE